MGAEQSAVTHSGCGILAPGYLNIHVFHLTEFGSIIRRQASRIFLFGE